MYTNRSSGERGFRIIFFGAPTADTPALLTKLRASVPAELGGATMTARGAEASTIFTDAAPPGLPRTDGFVTRLFLYTLDGTPSRDDVALVLTNGDLVVFVEDESPAGAELDDVWRGLLDDALATKEGEAGAVRPKVLSVRASEQTSEALFAKLGEAVVAGVADGSMTEWQPSPEKRRAGLEMNARARLIGHFASFLGEVVDEYTPEPPLAGRPGFVVVELAPSPERPFWTYATAGLSLFAQEGGGKSPRLELFVRTPERARTVVDILMMLGRQVLLRTAEDGPYDAYDALRLPPDVPAPSRDFFLSPCRESAAFLAFPSVSTRPEDVRFTYAITGDLETHVPVAFLDLVPATPEEIDLAKKLGARAVLERRRGPAA
jgi:hypothetical protein